MPTPLWFLRVPARRGAAVALGRVGERPVGQPERVVKLKVVWQPVTARVLLTNVANRRSFELRGAGSYVERPGRLLAFNLTASW